MIGLLLSTCAFAQAPGVTEGIYASGPSTRAVNVSMTGDEGDLWFAIETVDISATDEPALFLIWYNVPAYAMSGKMLQGFGELVGDGIYPSVLTWRNATNVLVTGKRDGALLPPPPPKGNEAHLRIYTQDRDQFGLPDASESVTPSGPYEHAVPHLALDETLPAQHLCWTDKTTSGLEHVQGKVQDGSTWLSSTLRPVAQTVDIEDHCGIDFTYSGRRFTVYHRDQAGSDPDIFLEITTWDGSTWTEVAEFGLTDSDGLDFPSLWIWNTPTTTEVGIVAFNPDPASGNFAYWNCGPSTEASCDSAAEFGSPQATTSGGNRLYPEVIIVPRDGTTDTFVLAENDATTTVKLLSLCGGVGSSFAEEGSLPLPAMYPKPTKMGTGFEQRLGYRQSWARSQVYWDGTKVHAAFLLESKGTPGSFGVAHYRVAPGDLCP